MPITSAMLAGALLKYFAIEQHSKEFENLLFELYKINDGYIIWRGDAPNNDRITLTVTKLDHGGSKLAEDYYSIKIERE